MASEQANFDLQLRRLRETADLVSIDQALAVLASPSRGDRHICLTFDDGRSDAFDHALPILVSAAVPAAFFVVSSWIDTGKPGIMRWPDVRSLVAAGMTVGSHTVTHRRLARLGPASVRAEFRSSRDRISAASGVPCKHFAAPFGQPQLDFMPERDPGLAQEAGFESFFTSIAAMAPHGVDRLCLPRVRMEPSWGQAELRYALWR